MTCTHNGDNMGDAVYALACLIVDGPHPQFNASPSALSFEAAQAGDVMPSQQTTISNSSTDAADTTLNSTSACVLAGTDAGQYSLSGGVTYSLLKTGGVSQTSVLTVSCNATAEGDYNDATVSCPHDGANASPGIIDLSCKVNPAGAAAFGSEPVAPGGIIDFTPGDDAIVGTDPPNKTNNIQNTTTDVNDNDLWVECSLSANAAILETTDNNGFFIAPNSSRPATFTCSASTADNYNATYTCDYGVDGTESTGAGTATYDVDCDVREAKSEVNPMPASTTPLLIPVDAGGTGTNFVVFEEVADEGIDGKVSCTLANDTDFHIISPTFPAIILAGDSVTVTVEGTDPDDGSSPTDTLTCTYTDTANLEGTDAVYPLELVVGGETTTIDVTKVFTDGNPGVVRVTLTCDTGLPLKQFFDISEGNGVSFVVTSFESGTMNCSVTEEATSSYSGTYVASGDSASVDDDPDAPGCHFLAIEGGDGNACSITNSPDSVDVVIEKEWLFAGSFSDLEIYYELTLYCDTEIVGGDPYLNGVTDGPASSIHLWYQEFEGTSPDNATFTAEVIPGYPSSNCWVDEEVFSDAVEVDNGCGDLVVSAGNGDSCTVTNTVFFEGIPTLSQYGLAIMALLMLGIGMVGFRRFS